MLISILGLHQLQWETSLTFPNQGGAPRNSHIFGPISWPPDSQYQLYPSENLYQSTICGYLGVGAFWAGVIAIYWYSRAIIANNLQISALSGTKLSHQHAYISILNYKQHINLNIVCCLR